MLRFGLDNYPMLARAYSLLMMLAMPLLFPPLFVIAYAPKALRKFAYDVTMNYRDAWHIFTGRYHRERTASQATEGERNHG
ncbi:hypothetical protein M1D55_19550 [Cupriavidus sp. JZ107]